MKSKAILKATHQGELDINGLKISCAVLDDGTRVISEKSVSNSLGTAAPGSYWQKRKEEKGAVLPRYLYAKFLLPYISEDLVLKLSESKNYVALNGSEATGVPAEVLPEICDVWIKAHQKGAVPMTSQEVAERAYMLLKGFANVGIIALVDEATGYQYERERDELQKILKAYISPELLPWQQRFPNDFYVQLFRLNGWDYTTKGIKKRPGVIGKWTKTLVYEQLPKGVLQELERTTPKNDAGKYKAKLHQSLTEDIGNPHLGAQITQIVTLFKLSDNMAHMWSQFRKLRTADESKAKAQDYIKFTAKEPADKPKQTTQLELPFEFDEKGHTIEPIEESTLSDFNKGLKKMLDFNPKEEK